MTRSILTAIAALALFALPTSAQTPPARIRGIVDSFDGKTLVVKTPDGQSTSVTVPADLRIMANANGKLSDIKPGDFVGSAADKGPDGKLHAEEVHIFPETMRGTGEGHRPMGPNPDRTMTNGTVAMSDPESRTMTNGTVSATAGSASVILTIHYKEGEQRIEVAPGTPIVVLVPGDRSLIKPGGTVSLAAAQKDTGMVATSLTAEKDGVKPR